MQAVRTFMQRNTVPLVLALTTTPFMLRLAWIGDDSLITLRTALNAAHGWGWGFNALEHVQGYTHPLWFLSWLVLGKVTDEWTLSIIGFSVALSFLALTILFRLAKTRVVGIGALVAVLLSNSFIEYTSSGLENPMGYVFLMTLFAFCRVSNGHIRHWMVVGLVAALALLTRLDYMLVFILPLAWLIIRDRPYRWKRLGWFTLGAAPPLLVWFAWSYATYSSLLPNTFLAKRNLDIPLGELVERGFHYVFFSFRHDPVTPLIIGCAVTLSFLSKNVLNRLWSVGVLIYLAYVIQNGGDFMVGRFLSVPFLVCLAILVIEMDDHLSSLRLTARRKWLVAAALSSSFILMFALASPSSLRRDLTEQRWSISDPGARGIVDERAFYTRRGLSPWTYRNDPVRFEGNVTLGVVDREAQLWPSGDSALAVPVNVMVECGGLGSFGLNSDPYTHIIDTCGLTDRFVAGIPYVPTTDKWMPGHFGRTLPEGYEDAIRASDPKLVVDPTERRRLTELWRRIRD